MAISDRTAGELLSALESGGITALQIAEALCERATGLSSLNSLVLFDAERFLAAARNSDDERTQGRIRGRLHGLPLVIKDNIDVAGFPTTAATPALFDHRPRRTAPVADKLLDAGAIVMGKTNMHELAFSPGITKSPDDTSALVFGGHGNARNPYDIDRSPAGSSTGTAAAIGARIAPAGLGSDTGGSVRNPAAWCGITGHRPTLHRYDQTGVVPISWTRDTIGPMARTVADLQLLDEVIAGEPDRPEISLSSLRLGLDRGYFCDGAEPGVLAVFERELNRLADAGAEIVEITIPGLEKQIAEMGQIVSMYEIVQALPRYLEQSGATVTRDEIIDRIAANGLKDRLGSLVGPEAVTDKEYERSLTQQRPALQNTYRGAFADNRLDALVFPSTMVTASPLQEVLMHPFRGGEITHFAAAGHNVQPASQCGFPGLTIAMGLCDNGLPAAIGFDGLPGEDRKLLAIGAAYEAIRPPMPGPEISTH